MSSSVGYTLCVRQQPVAARACGSADRPDRRPIDPIVIVELEHSTPGQLFATGERSTFFCVATLIEDPEKLEHTGGGLSDASSPVSSNLLTGTILSSIFYLKDPAKGSQTGAFFVFSDLNIRSEGTYKLRFDVFCMSDGVVVPIANCISAYFTVFSAKRFPGMTNSTELSKIFSDQGLKIRIRKDIRVRKKLKTSREQGIGSSATLENRLEPQLGLRHATETTSGTGLTDKRQYLGGRSGPDDPATQTSLQHRTNAASVQNPVGELEWDQSQASIVHHYHHHHFPQSRTHEYARLFQESQSSFAQPTMQDQAFTFRRLTSPPLVERGTSSLVTRVPAVAYNYAPRPQNHDGISGSISESGLRTTQLLAQAPTTLRQVAPPPISAGLSATHPAWRSASRAQSGIAPTTDELLPREGVGHGESHGSIDLQTGVALRTADFGLGGPGSEETSTNRLPSFTEAFAAFDPARDAFPPGPDRYARTFPAPRGPP